MSPATLENLESLESQESSDAYPEMEIGVAVVLVPELAPAWANALQTDFLLEVAPTGHSLLIPQVVPQAQQRLLPSQATAIAMAIAIQISWSANSLYSSFQNRLDLTVAPQTTETMDLARSLDYIRRTPNQYDKISAHS